VRRALGLLVVLLLAALWLCQPVAALPAPAGTQAGHAVDAAKAEAHKKEAPCATGIPVIGEAVSKVCEGGEAAAGAVGGLVGEAAGAAAEGVLGMVASWMIGAATAITSFVAEQMRATTTPQLASAWYESQFAPMADLGAALGLLVALIALGSAAIRRSPDALAATLAGIGRAGLGTTLAVALTVIGLSVADQVSAAVLSSSPHAFWGTVAHAWGKSGFGGFGSSALATLIALIEVLAAVFVWLELIVRNAGIYVAVLFFPVTLAAGIWPALASWPRRLGRLLLMLVILKPVALIVLSLAGNAAAAGLSFGESGIPGSVGTILAATVIFALAAFAPWALMYLLAADAEGAYALAGLRSAAGTATTDKGSRSVRTAGGLRGRAGVAGGGGSSSGSGGRPGGGAGGGRGGGGTPRGGAGSNAAGGGTGNGGAGGGQSARAGRPATVVAAPSRDSADGEADQSLPVGEATVPAGAVAAAAGLSTQDAPAARRAEPALTGGAGEGRRPPAPAPATAGAGQSASDAEVHAPSQPPRHADHERAPRQGPSAPRTPMAFPPHGGSTRAGGGSPGSPRPAPPPAPRRRAPSRPVLPASTGASSRPGQGRQPARSPDRDRSE
jgi:hypothetical protein